MTFWSLDSVDGGRVAIVRADGGITTYTDLLRLADNWSQRFAEASGTIRPVIALEFSTSVEAIAAYLGALRMRLPVLVGAPGQFAETGALLQAWQPRLRVIDRGDGLELMSAGLADEAPPPPHSDLALLLSTSGTTGDPKLVRLSAANISSNASAIAEYLGLRPDDRTPTTLPLFYSYGLSVLNSYLAAGASVMLTERSVTEPAFWDAFREHRATSLALVPHQFDLLAAAAFERQHLPTLRYITQAGGRLPEPRVRQFAELGRQAGWQLFVMYGQTEASPRIAYVPPAALAEAADTIGQAIPGGRLWLAGDDGLEIAAAGVAGELVYEGPNVMMGYAQTLEDLALGAGEPVLRTGDIAERTEQGFFRIVGRSKRFVKLFGLRISLDQVERTLAARGIAAHALSIDDRLVLLHLDPDQGDTAIAVTAEACHLPISAIHAVHLAHVPLLPSHKPDEQAMLRLAGAALDARDRIPAAHDVDIATLLMQATRRRTIRPGDSFNSLGGDSLSYIQVQVGLEERFGQAPPGWEDLTLAELEALVSTKAPAGLTREVGIDLLLRVAALCLVIGQHASDYPLNGGPWMLLTLMGYSAARFQLGMIAQARPLRLAWQMLYPIVPIYLAIVVIYNLFRNKTPIQFYNFSANYIVTHHSLLTVYWFVSLYIQIVLLLMVVSAVKVLRREVVSRSWTCAAAVLTALMAINAAIALSGGYVDINSVHHGRTPYVAIHGLLECLPIFLIGWMIRRMKTPVEVFRTVALAFGEVVMFAALRPPPEAVVFLGSCMILIAIEPHVRLSVKLARVVQKMAAATMFVYLFHEMAVFFIGKAHLSPMLTVIAAIPVAFIVAMMAKSAFDVSERWLIQRFASRPMTRYFRQEVI